MVFVYLSIGIVLVLAIHTLLRFLTRAEPATIRKASRIGLVLLLVLALLLFIRVGLPHMAAITGFVALLATLVRRFMLARNLYHTATGKNGKAGKSRKSPARMDAAQAQQILGLEPDATADEIRAAHKRLINKNHPDKGGSEYLASQINEARDVLLANHKDTNA